MGLHEQRARIYKGENMDNELVKNLEQLHTTELGIVRIKRNLSINTDNVIEWCKAKINSADAVITRKGKNWYVNADGCIITVNAYSYTVITAHQKKQTGLTDNAH